VWSNIFYVTIELQTDRLILRPLELADAGQMQPLFARWEIVQHLNAKVPWPFPEDGVLTYYREAALPAIERGEEWHWSLRLKTSPEQIIGAIGLSKGDSKNRGFWIGSQWQRQGLMTEAVIAVNDYWFDVLKFPVLRASKAIANITSRRISEKTGMRAVATGTSEYVSGRLPSETWEITAEEWRDWRRAQATAVTPRAANRTG
jgi:[ribosomal protein S5]-alanine N-acetyltransferase